MRSDPRKSFTPGAGREPTPQEWNAAFDADGEVNSTLPIGTTTARKLTKAQIEYNDLIKNSLPK